MDNLFQQSTAPCRRLVRGGPVAAGARDVRQADMLISEKVSSGYCIRHRA